MGGRAGGGPGTIAKALAQPSVVRVPPVERVAEGERLMEGIRTPGAGCRGPLQRREFLRLGLVRLGGLTWPELLRRRAVAGADLARRSRLSGLSRIEEVPE
jgi:hypothetical protein